MRAIVVKPPAPGAHLLDLPDPEPHRGELLIRVLECGVCGTDRDIVAGQYGTPPPNSSQLVLGHENLGVVEAPGPGVPGWKKGDLVVATVRRGCGVCRFCLTDQSDFCETGQFTERGIRGRDGYFSDLYTEIPRYLVRVPQALRDVAVLLEPLSVVEKAYHEGRLVLDRRGATPGHVPEEPARALVAGTGAIGMLSAFLLRSEGFEVTAIDRHGDDTAAASVLTAIGASHVNAAAGTSALGRRRFELVVEASGNAPLDFDLLGTLGPNGVLVLTGIPPSDPAPVPVPGGQLLRNLVLANQAIVGSVNANRRYFELGLRHLQLFRRFWGPAVQRLISDRRPLSDFQSVLTDRSTGGMKTVIEFARGQ